MIRSFIKGFFFSLILVLSGIGAFIYVSSREAPEAESTHVASPLSALRKLGFARKSQYEERTWTDPSGKTIEGTFVAGGTNEALVRVSSSQRVYRIPFSRLSTADQDYVREVAKEPELFAATYPPVSDRWPIKVEGRTQPLNLKKDPNSNRWTTTHYEFRPDSDLEPKLAKSLATTCEAVDVALRRCPLPLLWKRDLNKKRVIVIYKSAESFLATTSLKHSGAYFDVDSHEIHVPLDSLIIDQAPIIPSRFSLRKRDTYKILVHELVHQASVHYLILGMPAWIAEGTAEFLSAMQTIPGRFDFTNHHLQIRNHLSEMIDPGETVEFRALTLPKLDPFFYEKIGAFNRRSGASKTGGFVEYAAALFLVEYFSVGEPAALRAYHEAIITGTPPREALETHLLRDRSLNEIEHLVTKRWEKLGLKLQFSENPKFDITNFRKSIGG